MQFVFLVSGTINQACGIGLVNKVALVRTHLQIGC